MQIVVRQISGLGNQLFQYAAGLYFAKRYGASLRIATDPAHKAFSYGYSRPFLLPQFAIESRMKSLSFEEQLLLSEKPWLQPTIAKAKRLMAVQVVAEGREHRYTFMKDLPLQIGVRTVYLAGYWQAHRFADCVAKELHADLRFRSEAAGENRAMLQRIKNCATPVSLHIRRGDYTLAAEGNIALPLAYYDDAIAHFRKHTRNPVFFVFSDDIAFARANLAAKIEAVFIDHNSDASSHEDLRLMSACHHHIIANSSFSWWGAWLNPRPDKIVFAPRYWHLHPGSYFPQLLPPEWTLGSF